MERIYSQYKDYIFRTCYYILFDPQLAEDVLQDTFITAFQKIKQLKNVDSFKAWLTQIAIRHSRKLLKDNAKLAAIELNESLLPCKNSPEELVVAKELNLRLYHALGGLKAEDRLVVTLYYFNELKVKEIAELINYPEGTVKWHLHRIRQVLLRKLEDNSSKK